MWHARARVFLAAAWLALFGAWLPGAGWTNNSQAQVANGRILAVVGRQVGFLNLEAPRPRVLTALSPPSFAMDVAAVAGSKLAAISVAEPFDQQGELGGDLLGLDLATPEQQALMPLVVRTDSGEWLGAPVWLADGSALLFQREDLRAGSDPYSGQMGVRYPSRIEMVAANGVDRAMLVGYGHHPSPSPRGDELAFVRLSPRGGMLMVRDMLTAEERTLVAPGTLADLAYPRYSPDGDQIAFVATTPSAYAPARGWLAPNVAIAHGLLWNLWIVQRDGSGLRQLAAVGADDASIAWSPDGSKLMVYGSNGARLVDAASGETDLLSFLAGFGAISWLP